MWLGDKQLLSRNRKWEDVIEIEKILTYIGDLRPIVDKQGTLRWNSPVEENGRLGKARPLSNGKWTVTYKS